MVLEGGRIVVDFLNGGTILEVGVFAGVLLPTSAFECLTLLPASFEGVWFAARSCGPRSKNDTRRSLGKGIWTSRPTPLDETSGEAALLLGEELIGACEELTERFMEDFLPLGM